MSDITELKIAYDGAALKNHEMSISELGTALLSIGDMFNAANTALNGGNTKLDIRVKAHEAGSFEIALVMELLKGAEDILNSDFINSVINLKELIFMGGTVGAFGLFSFLKKTKGKHPEKITKGSNGNYTLIIDNSTYNISSDLFTLYSDRAVRTAMEKVVSPLGKEGIDTFKVIDDVKDTGDFILTKDEELFFIVSPPADAELIDEVRKGAYSIISLAFKEDNRWRLSDGQNIFSVIIKDEDFLKKVANDEISFAKNDILVCEIRIKQWQTAEGLKTDYELLQVIEHRPSFKQMRLL